jgi:predicted O-methyltransferase YrrM
MSGRLRKIPRVLGYAARQLYLGARGKAFPIAALDDLAWYSSSEKLLPTVALETIFPGISQTVIRLNRAVPKQPGNLTTDELCVVAMICQLLAPRRIFEFGTCNGRTTLNLARNTPEDAEIFTLDLPETRSAQLVTDKQDERFVLGTRTGFLFRDTAYENKIHQLFDDSAVFNESEYRGQMNLVFVDASHTYEYVRNDSTKGLNMLASGGVMIWHDYCASYPGVPRNLHELYRERKLCHVEGTHLAVMPPSL